MSKSFKKKSGIEKIQQYLQSGRSLTALEAMSNFGLFRLASAIEVLRKRGLNIVTDMKQDPNGKTYARYTLVKGEPVPAAAPTPAPAPQRELKVGDTVTVNETYGSSRRVFNTYQGVVRHIRKFGSWPVEVKFPHRACVDYFKASELEAI